MVDGLWVGGSEAATDFAAIAYQIAALGYNTVRLPFRWQDLDARPKDQVCCCCLCSVWVGGLFGRPPLALRPRRRSSHQHNNTHKQNKTKQTH